MATTCRAECIPCVHHKSNKGVPEFKKIIEIKEIGLCIYQHIHRNPGAGTDANAFNKDVFIMCNKSCIEITNEDIRRAFDMYSSDCPRCNEVISHLHNLLDDVPILDKNKIIGICDHCKRRADALNKPCDCEKISKIFISIKPDDKLTVQSKDSSSTEERKILKSAIERDRTVANKEVKIEDITRLAGMSTNIDVIKRRSIFKIARSSDNIIKDDHHVRLSAPKVRPASDEDLTYTQKYGDQGTSELEQSAKDGRGKQNILMTDEISSESLRLDQSDRFQSILASDKEFEMKKLTKLRDIHGRLKNIKEPEMSFINIRRDYSLHDYIKHKHNLDDNLSTMDDSDAPIPAGSRNFMFYFPKENPKKESTIHVTSAELIQATRDKIRMKAMREKEKEKLIAEKNKLYQVNKTGSTEDDALVNKEETVSSKIKDPLGNEIDDFKEPHVSEIDSDVKSVYNRKHGPEGQVGRAKVPGEGDRQNRYQMDKVGQYKMQADKSGGSGDKQTHQDKTKAKERDAKSQTQAISKLPEKTDKQRTQDQNKMTENPKKPHSPQSKTYEKPDQQRLLKDKSKMTDKDDTYSSLQDKSKLSRKDETLGSHQVKTKISGKQTVESLHEEKKQNTKNFSKTSDHERKDPQGKGKSPIKTDKIKAVKESDKTDVAYVNIRKGLDGSSQKHDIKGQDGKNKTSGNEQLQQSQDPQKLAAEAKAREAMMAKVEMTKHQEQKAKSIDMKNVKLKKSSHEGNMSLLVKLDKTAMNLKDIPPLNPFVIDKPKTPKDLILDNCDLCKNSEQELDESMKGNPKLNGAGDIVIIGNKVHKYKRRLKLKSAAIKEQSAMLFKTECTASLTVNVVTNNATGNSSQKTTQATTIVPDQPSKQAKHVSLDYGGGKGVIQYALSDRTFIENGWTVLPTERIVRKMNVYRMRPAHPEFDWFAHNKHRENIMYENGKEKLAEIDENGTGRWYYRNGRLALNYYNAEEQNARERYVVYSNGENDERGNSRPYTVLATFDFLGNAIVYDHSGNVRMKYNQTEGILLDTSLGPVTHWKWHTLNEPPVLQQVMIDTYQTRKDPEITKLGNPPEEKFNPENEEMLAIEFDNSVKEKAKKLSQKFKPFQIKMKALRINENFSLKVLDQASVYLIFRDGMTNLKLNLGMVLDHQEIIDTDTAEVGMVSTNMEILPAKTESLSVLQKMVTHAQYKDKKRLDREKRLKRQNVVSSRDRMLVGMSKPLRLSTIPSTLFNSSTTTRIDCTCSKFLNNKLESFF